MKSEEQMYLPVYIDEIDKSINKMSVSSISTD